MFLIVVHSLVTGGYLRPCEPQIALRVRLAKVSVYGRLKT